MASPEKQDPVEQPVPDLEPGEVHDEHNSTLKEQTSPQHDGKTSQKRHHQDDESPRAKRARISPSSDYASLRDERPGERAKPATLEEKKRGKRLFGGLLSTLNQKPSNSQQQRRQEIERRQQERIQKQEALDDKERGQRAAKLREARMAEQITFDERVMKHRHSKKLALAKLLKTRSRPHIYYMPWKCTEEQKDIIDDQIRDAEDEVDRELKAFEAKRERHIQKYGPPRQKPDATLSTASEKPRDPVSEDAREDEQEESRMDDVSHTSTVAKEDRRPLSKDIDDGGDIMEQAGDDAVIY